jgi:hypothetical protein
MNTSHRTAAKGLCFVLPPLSTSWIDRMAFGGASVLFVELWYQHMVGVLWLAKNDVKIAFSVSDHTLMTLLIISYLVVGKVNLTYDGYMNAPLPHAIGHALSSLGELNQLVMAYYGQTNVPARKWSEMNPWKKY